MIIEFKKFVCRIFGHKWRGNFPSGALTSARFCARCGLGVQEIFDQWNRERVYNPLPK